jgi:hypothetical protein
MEYVGTANTRTQERLSTAPNEGSLPAVPSAIVSTVQNVEPPAKDKGRADFTVPQPGTSTSPTKLQQISNPAPSSSRPAHPRPAFLETQHSTADFLKEHTFFQGLTSKDSVDIAVIYICGNADDDPDFSVFLYHEYEQRVDSKVARLDAQRASQATRGSCRDCVRMYQKGHKSRRNPKYCPKRKCLENQAQQSLNQF